MNLQSPIVPTPILELSNVSKAYGGLRPLRLRALSVTPGSVVALAGFDQTTAEVFVNLVTGATLPEEGTVRVFGRATSEIADSADWLATVDRFGIVSERVVLLEQFTPLQNIAMSLTLDVEPLPADVRQRAESWRARPGSTAMPSIGRSAGAASAAPSRPPGARAGDLARRAADRASGGRSRAARDRAARQRHHARGRDSRRGGDRAGGGGLDRGAVCDEVLTLNGGTGELTESKARGVFGRLARAVKGTG